VAPTLVVPAPDPTLTLGRVGPVTTVPGL
jgi:hypothetical protein